MNSLYSRNINKIITVLSRLLHKTSIEPPNLRQCIFELRWRSAGKAYRIGAPALYPLRARWLQTLCHTANARSSVRLSRIGASIPSHIANIVSSSCTFAAPVSIARSGILPAHQRGLAAVGEAIDAALDAVEPAINISTEYFRRIRRDHLQVTRTPRALRQSGGAGQCLLPIGRHDGLSRAATDRWIPTTTLVLAYNS
jgi:hypothetical protein